MMIPSMWTSTAWAWSPVSRRQGWISVSTMSARLHTEA